MVCVNMGEQISHYQIDARRLLCPMPVIKTQNMAKSLKQGDRVEIICTDPGAINDIPSWCRMYGHQVISIERQSNNEIIIIIEIN
mgnify:CR=1 FL=1